MKVRPLESIGRPWSPWDSVGPPWSLSSQLLPSVPLGPVATHGQPWTALDLLPPRLEGLGPPWPPLVRMVLFGPPG